MSEDADAVRAEVQQLRAELVELRAMRERAVHIADHSTDPASVGAALRILGQQRMWTGLEEPDDG